MNFLYVLLTGLALFSRPCPAAAQEGAGAARDRPAQAAELKACCQKIARDMQRIYYLHDRDGKVRLVVRGVYARGKSLFFSLKLVNRSPSDFNVDSIRFFVAEKQKGMRTLRRLKELAPLYVFDSLTSIEGYSKAVSIYVLPRLKLTRHRRLQIEILEKTGSRHLMVGAANFTLETAKLI